LLPENVTPTREYYQMHISLATISNVHNLLTWACRKFTGVVSAVGNAHVEYFSTRWELAPKYDYAVNYVSWDPIPYFVGWNFQLIARYCCI
jgi:hypothetical protein